MGDFLGIEHHGTIDFLGGKKNFRSNSSRIFLQSKIVGLNILVVPQSEKLLKIIFGDDSSMRILENSL